jgi:hypothetical protein
MDLDLDLWIWIYGSGSGSMDLVDLGKPTLGTGIAPAHKRIACTGFLTAGVRRASSGHVNTRSIVDL